MDDALPFLAAHRRQSLELLAQGNVHDLDQVSIDVGGWVIANVEDRIERVVAVEAPMSSDGRQRLPRVAIKCFDRLAMLHRNGAQRTQIDAIEKIIRAV